MSVLKGPRRELRRVLHNGAEYWGAPVEGGIQLADGRVIELDQVTHLPPCQPSKIICMHLNYASRYYELRGKRVEDGGYGTPNYFMKPPTTLNAHGGEIVRPDGYQYLNYEGEIGMVVGRVTRNILPEEAWDQIAGFTCALDMGLQDMRDTDAGSMLRVKGHDGYCPVGPGLVSGIDIREQTLRTYRNGEVVQEGVLAEEMLWGFDYVLADLARHITLLPGDLILTATPANSRPLEVGDRIEVEVTGLGRLSNTVVAAPAPRAEVGHSPTSSDEVRRVSLGNDERLPASLRARTHHPV
ncbi:fumarylacetoacetate hydrolase family protein [Halomonas ramblicola]|uniref:fumarylacetoacetate hydrolase family protein n=1 Tax=Halomonas ramblicola TaxID=747349 RepID=UPI0025B47D9F|nr:fumarylacetoacetate hydrolase family protein [Halomonas ramblicola]MDN3522005.1 fumarylacetoacetate hydrolase family protein [Halomonas ramblicola]